MVGQDSESERGARMSEQVGTDRFRDLRAGDVEELARRGQTLGEKASRLAKGGVKLNKALPKIGKRRRGIVAPARGWNDCTDPTTLAHNLSSERISKPNNRGLRKSNNNKDEEKIVKRNNQKKSLAQTRENRAAHLLSRLSPQLELLPGFEKRPIIKFKRPTWETIRIRQRGPLKCKQPESSSSSSTSSSSSLLSNNHVKNCTCPQCRKLKRLSKTAPIQLKYKASISLIESTLEANTFRKTKQNDWNVLWVSGSIKPHFFHTISRHQKVNQFPKTYEITRKDQLSRNMMRMQQQYGKRFYDFYPKTFVLPEDRTTFEAEVRNVLLGASNAAAAATSNTTIKSKRVGANRGGDARLWIVKPAANACGRGIYLTSNVAEIPVGGMDESNVIVSEYIADPLLLDERKFDLRVYVAVTSFAPLRIWVHDEGLVRLTTQAYSKDPDTLKNRFVHLTNYSVQKYSEGFVANNNNNNNETNPSSPNSAESASSFERAQENSSKWSFKTFRNRLAKMGHDPDQVFKDIETVVTKTLISIEPQVVRALEMHSRYESSSFQLFGFDILIDEKLKPWLIEVNNGPSMGCDSTLDFEVKSTMISDLLTLAGVRPCDIEQERAKEDLPKTMRPPSASRSRDQMSRDVKKDAAHLNACLARLAEEKKRAGGWRCVYPTPTSFVFDRFFEAKGINQAVVKHLSALTSVSDKKRFVRKLSRKSSNQKGLQET